MFKRLFFLSGIIAFICTCLVMWFWYLPSQQLPASDKDSNAIQVDSVSAVLDEPDIPADSIK